MSSKELNALKWQRPFKPFRIRTSANGIFDITEPGLILVGKADINIGIPHPQEPLPSVSDVVWLGMEEVVEVEYLKAAAK